jgi:type II secretory pathway predicted ATPase ExeA
LKAVFATTGKSYTLSHTMGTYSDSGIRENLYREKIFKIISGKGVEKTMTDDLKVKASHAVDDARVAAHAVYDDATVAAHNTLKDAGDAVHKASDNAKIGVHKAVADAKIAVHEAGSKMKKR